MQTPTNKDSKLHSKLISPMRTPDLLQKPLVDSTVKRRVSDVCVSFHKCIQQWESDNLLSFNTASTLCNLYSQWNFFDEEEEKIEELSESLQRKYYVKVALQREDLLKQLKGHRLKLKINIEKLTSLVDSLKVIYYMSAASVQTLQQNEPENMPVVFTTWTPKMFYINAKLILNMYTKEYLLKERLFDHFFAFRLKKNETTKVGILTQCISIWLHQPYIEPKIKFLLDSMLVEAELK
ncbi:cyclin-dependent kinase 2-interacting protein [Hydra vulgaris]|uniref:Cyclin-dependent kinase 2-interacting protein n=1 Tax=Hydra vulgaris TaxID=6087 RepID=A0ABM4CIG5_HYDVU